MKKRIMMAIAILLSVTTIFAQQKINPHQHQVKTVTKYTCPMHHEVVRSKPGKCPKCGMTLIPMKTKKATKSMGDMKM